MKKKRKQHYVWEYYLQAWAINGQVACLRNKESFTTSTENILQTRDFYRLSLVDEKTLRATVDVINQMFSSTNLLNAALISELVNDYFSFFNTIKSNNKEIGNEQMKNESIDILMNNYIEDKHSEIESDAIKYIDKLRNKDNSFLRIEVEKVRFENFIMTQYLRTNNIRKNFLNAMNNPLLIEKSKKSSLGIAVDGLKETWPIFHLLTARLFAASFSLMNYKCVFLITGDDSEFITGDQPVVNTKADEKDNLGNIKYLEFYYPITNKLAILLTQRCDKDEIIAYKEDVDKCNSIIIKFSDEHIIATREDIFRNLKK